jgi:FkbM family methyltransferase
MAKIRNLFRMFSKLRFGSVLKFYRLKYLTGSDTNVNVFHLRNGLSLNVRKNEGDLTTLYEVFVDEDYSFAESGNRRLNILDIGANVGYFSLYAARSFDNAVIYSFEPFPDTFRKFSEHIQINKIMNINPYNLAVSDFDGSSKFYSFEWTGCNTLIDGNFDENLHKVTEVECRKFDSISDITGVREFDFAKVDCEGSEYPIFLNSKDETIRKVWKYILEVHNSEKYTKDQLKKRFEDLGYETILDADILTASRTV